MIPYVHSPRFLVLLPQMSPLCLQELSLILVELPGSHVAWAISLNVCDFCKMGLRVVTVQDCGVDQKVTNVLCSL